MRKPQPWHKVADKMRREGATLEDIAIEVDRSVTQVCRYFNPAYDARQKKLSQEYRLKRYREDLAWRAKRREYYRRKDLDKWALKYRKNNSASSSQTT